MAVNANKTNYITFDTCGKKIDPNLPNIVFSSNKINSLSPDPAQIYKFECIYMM